MVFAIILEPKFFDVMSKVENSFWSGDEAREKKRECVVKTHDRSETFVLEGNQNIVNYR
jgi:hypothetical protein